MHLDATVIGDVVLEDGANVWPGAVLRGDVERIVLGAHTSFQDNAVAHTDPGSPVRIGAGCIIGHGVIVHGATIGARCLIGMGSTLLNGCEIGEESIVGARRPGHGGQESSRRAASSSARRPRCVREVTDEDLAPRAGAARPLRAPRAPVRRARPGRRPVRLPPLRGARA